MIERFDDPLSGWKTRFLGLHSNLVNHYVAVNSCFYPSSVVNDDCRGNNWDGLWISDQDIQDKNSYIRFDPEFAATLTRLELDIGSHVAATLKIYDKDMNVLLSESIPLGCSNCSDHKPGANVYSHHGVASTNGIGGFDIVGQPANGVVPTVEGNVGIDNVTVVQGSVNETREVVEPDEAATVTVKEACDADPNGCAVAGIDIPENTFVDDQGNPVTVTVTVRLEKLDEGETCHAYLIGQIRECLEVTATKADGTDARISDALGPDERPIVGMCLPAGLSELDLYKWEEETGTDRAVAQREAETPFLNCAGYELASAAPKGWLEGLALGVAKRVGRWISPKPLYAADRGFGGHIDAPTLSFFTWAAPMTVSGAALAANVANSGKDVYTFWGTFGQEAKTFDPGKGEAGFNPARDLVLVGFGHKVHTIPINSFKWSDFFKRYVYAARVSSGITFMEINPATGKFLVAGTTVPSEGAGEHTHRTVTVRIGQRERGAFLECGTDESKYKCVLQH